MFRSDRTSDVSVLQNASLILTTYGIVATEYTLAANDTGRGLLYAASFFRIVLDEAHFIKNRAALVSRAVCGLRADRRWSLTGTPIQNKIDDLFSQLKFLRLEPWCVYQHWNANVNTVFEEDPGAGATVLQELLGPILLRRTKATKGKDGKPIVTLPSSKIDVVKVTLSPAERDFYEAVHTRSKSKFDEFVAQVFLRCCPPV